MKTTPHQLQNLVSNRLREIKDSEPGLDTLVKIAKKSGVSYGSIRNILAGKNVTTRILHAVAQAAGMSVSEFAAENGEMAELSQNERELIKALRLLSPELQGTYLKQITELAAYVQAESIAKLRRSELGLISPDSQSHASQYSRKNQ